MKGLMLHCGAHAVEREQVAGVNTPQRTETWTPISHEYLIASIGVDGAGNGPFKVSEGKRVSTVPTEIHRQWFIPSCIWPYRSDNLGKVTKFIGSDE